MRWLVSLGLAGAIAAVGFVVGSNPADARGKCVRAGGSANMITRDLAEFMAKAALKNSIKGMGARPAGPIKLTCKASFPVYCLARQKACK